MLAVSDGRKFRRSTFPAVVPALPLRVHLLEGFNRPISAALSNRLRLASLVTSRSLPDKPTILLLLLLNNMFPTLLKPISIPTFNGSNNKLSVVKLPLPYNHYLKSSLAKIKTFVSLVLSTTNHSCLLSPSLFLPSVPSVVLLTLFTCFALCRFLTFSHPSAFFPSLRNSYIASSLFVLCLCRHLVYLLYTLRY